MLKKLALALALSAVITPAAHAYDGKLTIKGRCKAENSGSCTLAVSGLEGNVKIFAATALNAKFGAVTRPFAAPATKRIANSVNNSCFYAKKVDSASRTRAVCISK